MGDDNLITEASSLITAGAGAAILYRRLPAGQLPSFINRRFRADYLSTGSPPNISRILMKHQSHSVCMSLGSTWYARVNDLLPDVAINGCVE